MKVFRLISFFIAFCTLVASSLALVVDSGDFFTGTNRINPYTKEVDYLGMLNPTSAYSYDTYLFVRTVQSQSGQLWRFDPTTGEQTLLLDGPNYTAVHGANIIAGTRFNELFFMSTDAVGGNAKVVAMNMDNLDVRTFSIPGMELERADLVTTPNNDLAAISNAGSAVTLVRYTGQVLTTAPVLGGNLLKGLTRTRDQLFGITSAGSGNIGLVEIEFDTGLMRPLHTFTGLDASNSHLRIAEDNNGNFFFSVYSSPSDFALYWADGETYGVSEINLPSGVELDALTTLKMEQTGTLLVSALDKRTDPENGNRVFLRIFPQNFLVKVAFGSPGANGIPLGHMTQVQDGYIYYVPSPDNGFQDLVLRMELKTGAVEVVTSKDRPGSILRRARQIALNGEDIWVIEENSGGTSYLVHVDAGSGAQTYLTQLGNQLQIQRLQYDGPTGRLLFTCWGGHPQGGAGTVMEVKPESDAAPVVLTQTPFANQPGGMTIAPDGNIYVCSAFTDQRIYKVNRSSGEWTVVANSFKLSYPVDMEMLGSRSLLVLDYYLNSILHIDTVTGTVSDYIPTVALSTYLVKVREASDPPDDPPDDPPADPDPLSSILNVTAYPDNWFQSEWFGWFRESGPWLFHQEHGWQYFAGGSADGFFLYDVLVEAWLWTSITYYPFFYGYPPYDSWMIYVEGGSPDNRFFFSYREEDWYNVKPGDSLQ